LDEDVSISVASLLRARGFLAVTTQEAGRLGQADTEQLAYAARQGMTLLTHNRVDFEALHRQYLAEGRIHQGIIVASRRHPHLMPGNLLRLLNRVTADE
jgi:predicted nuclease of predicted toxin-antitoxin system